MKQTTPPGGDVSLHVDPATPPCAPENTPEDSRKLNWRQRWTPRDLATLAAIAGAICALYTMGADWAAVKADNRALSTEVTRLEAELKDHDRLVDFAYAEVQQGHVNATSLCVIIHCPEGKSNLFPSIAISSPRRPDASTGNPITVGPVITVRGTVDADVLKGRKLWIVTQVSGVSKFYPQGNAGAHWGPAMMDAAKQRWTSPAVFLGQASDLGRHFDVVVVLADDAACQVFWKYLADGPKSGFPGISELPAGAQEYDRVEVVRGQ
ncbi:MAG: hypothetical protein QG622_490 [Actinomycetota bacterium]|nr:hypothetical protein [Actinomycetota bacterium]